ncbi:hypothetical protein FSP39_009846 [Pinctada imbricata]|uniref:DUF8117 domain-containing protein n=1 Tax=Pinctada imbricata TaxID=66713 RepID=A0AA89BZB1_PINIB|nr:hypothetical protein FSP39_009846 [Pinctada imbricata]
MRKIRLSDTDFEFFDYEVQPSEFQFFQKHKEAFLCMWKDQGKPFWTKFTITFRSFTVKHGIIKQMSTDLPKFDNLVDQAFIYIHENFVDGKESMARGFIDDIARLAQNHDKFPALDSKSFARDPFYIRETRELFRKFFGTPDEKASYLKVYILSPIYLRFGGSVCRCIKKWLDAPEIHPDDESYWTPPNGSTPCPRKVYLDIMCTPCLDACWDLYNKEKSSGNEKGPKYITCWKLGDPRFNDPKNPLYNLSAAKRSDWREDLKFEDFRDFLHFAKLKYGTDSEKCQDCLLLANCEDENATECPLEKQKKKKKKKKNKKKQNEENENNNTTGPSKETSTSEQGNGTDTKVKTGVDASTNFPSPKKDESSNTGIEMEKETQTSSGTDISQTNGSASSSPRKRRIVFSSRATITEDYKYGVMSTQDHRHPNSVDSHLVLGFRTIITEEKGKIETRVIVSTLKNKDREIIHKREGMTVNTLLLNAEMIKSKVENLPFKMEWWEGNCFCICVLDYEREERAICRKKKGKQYPTNFSLKVSNADDETCKMIMFKLLMYVGKRKKRESLGWTMTEEDVMTCVEAEDMKEHEGLTVSIMKGFRFEDRLSKEEEKSLFQQRLRETCRDGTVEEIIQVVGGKATSYHKDGMMAHHLVAMSAREDMEDMLDKLIQAGCDVNATTRSNDDTVLHLLIANCPMKIAFPAALRIMEYEPDLDIRNRNLRTPYDVAMAQGFYDLANVLDGSKTAEQAKDYFINQMGKTYGQKLIKAVLDDKEDEAIECVYTGADCNILNDHGCGAIHYLLSSYSHNPLNVLTAMMESNADVNLRDYEGDTVLNLTIKKTELRDSGEMYKIVEKLMGWGADPTCNDLDGNDAIALATKKNYIDILKLLRTKRKAMVTHKPKPRREERKKKDVTPREPPPKPRDRNYGNDTSVIRPKKDHPPPVMNNEDIPEDQASIIETVELGDDDELALILNDPDADLNVPNESGLYPIHIAVMRDDPTQRNQLVQRLINEGADINVRAIPSGNTPLHMAVARDQVGTVKLLLSHNPAYTVPNADGLTPKEIAENNGNLEIMQLLEDYKRSVDKNKNKSKGGVCVIL